MNSQSTIALVIAATLVASQLSGCNLRAASIIYPKFADQAGCTVEQITANAFDEFQHYGVSANGLWLSYGSIREEQGRTHKAAALFNLETGETVRLVAPINNSGSDSPDGDFLITARMDPEWRGDIYELELATGISTPIAKADSTDYLPSYSMDGRYLVFNSYRTNGQSDLYLYERSTKNPKRLTDFDDYDAHAQFSIDGRSILFHRMNGKRDDAGNDFDLLQYDLESGQESIVIGGPEEESYGSYSPDRQHVVFSSDSGNPPGQSNLYVTDLEGQTRIRLTRGDWQDTYAYWTHDGMYVYFNSNRDGVWNIYRLNMSQRDCERSERT